MTRDMDLVRELLLRLADAKGPVSFSKLVPGRSTGDENFKKAAYHMRMLIEEVGLVKGIDARTNSGDEWLQLQLTWRGHDFLEATRDPTVWDHTKEGVKKLGGVSWELLLDMAKAYAKAEAKKRLGLDL